VKVTTNHRRGKGRKDGTFQSLVMKVPNVAKSKGRNARSVIVGAGPGGTDAGGRGKGGAGEDGISRRDRGGKRGGAGARLS